MRRALRVLVVLAVLGGAAFLADTLLRAEAEDRVAAEVGAAVPGVTQDPEVTIEGFPFVTQLASGALQEVRVTAPTATVEGLRLQDVDVRLGEVTTSAPYTASTARMTALVTPEAATDALGLADVELGVRGDELVATTSALGLPLDVAMDVRAEGHDVVVDVAAFVLAGVRVDSADLPDAVTGPLQGLRFTVTGLPEGMTLTEVAVVAGGIEVAASGEDLDLSATG